MDGPASINPTVSVIMSVHNGERWLGKAVDSIVTQHFTDWEFIIVDDASTDGSKGILHSYAGDSRFFIITNAERKGLTANLNKAINRCRGKFIARMDADDISLASRFSKQVGYLESKKDVAAVFSFIDFIDEKGDPSGEWKDDRDATTHETIRKMLPWKNCLAHPTAMIRSDILLKYRYNELQKHSQDWDLWMRLASDDLRIEKIPEVLLLYRVHGKSVTSVSNKESAILKTDRFYKTYLKGRRKKQNKFDKKIYLGYLWNRLKIIPSRIKRFIKN